MIDLGDFREGARSLPQPIAIHLGRVARSREPTQSLLQLLTTAEALTKYVVVAAVSSLAGREDQEVPSAVIVEAATGSLAWGHFLNIGRQVASTPVDHPLKPVLVRGLGLGKSREPSGLDELTELLEVRNRTAHSAIALDRDKSAVLMDEEKVSERLHAALNAFAPLLQLLLLVVDEQRYVKRQLTAQVLPLVGEGVPFPVSLPVTGLVDDGVPYIAFGRQLISLAPGALWDVEPHSYRRSILFLDRIESDRVYYRGPNSDEHSVFEIADDNDPTSWLAGDPQPADELTTEDGYQVSRALEGQQVGLAVPDSPQPTDHPDAVTTAVDPADAVTTGSNEDARYRRKTVPELIAVADEAGLGPQFSALLGATEAIGLSHRPHTHGVMVAPPDGSNHFLMWIKIVRTKRPYLKVSIGRDRLAKQFGTSVDDATGLLGPDRIIHQADSVQDLVVSLRSLATLVDAAS